MKSKLPLPLSLFLILCAFAWTATANNPQFFGDPLAGLNAEQSAQFDDGKDEFVQVETVADGLGPVFNGRSCAECHANPATGGDSDIKETRFGKNTHNHFDPLMPLGGSLIQSQGIGPIGSCNIVGEAVPPEATIVAGRKTTPLFGLGLVDSVPDRVFIAIAEFQKRFLPRTAGRANLVTDVSTHRLAVGKFGWKGQNPNLKQFAADAYLNEMGITSPTFPNENCPQGDCSLLTTCGLAHADPEDDGSGVQAFTDFMTFLAPPPRGEITRQARSGELIFLQIGCAACHLPVLETGRNSVAVLDRVRFFPYSDFLLHDMGSLGDGIEQGRASGREMRTAPLWGLGVRNTFLHDGRATMVSDAILAHDGQGAGAKQQFSALTPKEMRDLLAFLKSL